MSMSEKVWNKARLNPRLHIFGVLLTMFDGRTNFSMQVAQEVRRHFPGKVRAGQGVHPGPDRHLPLSRLRPVGNTGKSAGRSGWGAACLHTRKENV